MTGDLLGDDGQHPKVIRIWRDETDALWDEHPGNLMSRRDSPNGEDQLVPARQVEARHTLREVWPAQQVLLFDVAPVKPYEARWSE